MKGSTLSILAKPYTYLKIFDKIKGRVYLAGVVKKSRKSNGLRDWRGCLKYEWQNVAGTNTVVAKICEPKTLWNASIQAALNSGSRSRNLFARGDALADP